MSGKNYQVETDILLLLLIKKRIPAQENLLGNDMKKWIKTLCLSHFYQRGASYLLCELNRSYNILQEMLTTFVKLRSKTQPILVYNTYSAAHILSD